MKNITTLLIVFITTSICVAQYKPIEHRTISENEIAVKTGGSYAKAGATYVLANDISSEKSTVFLGKDITFDLNGYTIKYTDANYGHIQNGGFEEGLQGWDVSKAPGAKVVNTADVHVFLGQKLMSLKAGDEIVSPYVYLPVASRSYFAMCGITGHYWQDMKKYPDDEMRVSVYVEDEKDNEVKCMGKYGDGAKQGCPVENKSPRLGGGFVYAHLNGLPAGKYRVRVKADTDCLVDEIDIRPAMDAAISIIEKTTPMVHYDHLIAETRPAPIPAFYDYTEDMKTGKPLSSLPLVEGKGTITIKNGTIENSAEGIQSWAIQSSAEDVKIILENVNIKTSGISCGAVYVPYADISNCRFDVDMPFLIQRHVGFCSVVIRGENPTEITNCEFNGGQGCLSINAKKSLVHDNLFVNNQTVTNHYSIMGTGEGSKIYNNRFEPKQGSGIYASRNTEVFDNIFRIETSPPTCEYGRDQYSTAAIRLGDYHAVPGSPKASVGSKIHGNKIFITAKNHPGPEEFIPVCWGIFYSARGGENFVYDNEFVVNNEEPSSKVIAAAFYICGGPEYFGGQFYNNRITTNVPAAWIATPYGGASNSRLSNNTIIPLNGENFKTFRMGSLASAEYVAQNVEFRSNVVEGGEFEIDVTDQDHSYSVYWTLKVNVLGVNGVPVENKDVTIRDKSGSIALQTKTNSKGEVTTELLQYHVSGKEKNIAAPYTIEVDSVTNEVELNGNKEIVFTLK